MRRIELRLALGIAGLSVALASAPAVWAQDDQKSPTARGTGGAAATVDLLATQAATDVLEDGGNSHLARVPAAGGAMVRVLDGERDVADSTRT